MPKMPPAFSVALIDDCPVTRYLCRRSFEQQGIAVRFEAANGLDFLSQLEGSRQLPDACLLDIDMPVMDGHETACRLSMSFPEITILAYSSGTEPYIADRVLKCGAHGFMAKGCRPAAYGEALIYLHKDEQMGLRSPPVLTNVREQRSYRPQCQSYDLEETVPSPSMHQ